MPCRCRGATGSGHRPHADGTSHPKLRELVCTDLTDYADVEPELAGYDAYLFCLGVSSSGMDERDYVRTTYDLAMAAAGVLLRQNPTMTFIYVSGAGATEPCPRFQSRPAVEPLVRFMLAGRTPVTGSNILQGRPPNHRIQHGSGVWSVDFHAWRARHRA